MKRTISLRIYPSDSYASPLVSADGVDVRLLYARVMGNNFAMGSAVPGAEFEHQDNGVWERSINTALLDPYRTDYYYVQYTLDSGSNWVNVAGYDPFYFNTRIQSIGESVQHQPISHQVPKTPEVTSNAFTAEILLKDTYDGDVQAINPAHIREISYAMSADNPATAGWENGVTYIVRRTLDDVISITRGVDAGITKYLGIKYRIFNQLNNEYSDYSEIASHQFAAQTAAELIDTADLADPPEMTSGDVTEINVWGKSDGLRIAMPSLTSRGLHSELAMQYGGETPPTISMDGELVDFIGNIVQATDTHIVVSKPLTLRDTDTLYLARRIVGYDAASKWVGDADGMYVPFDSSAPIALPEKNSIISPEIIDAIMNYLLPKIESSTGDTINRRQVQP